MLFVLLKYCKEQECIFSNLIERLLHFLYSSTFYWFCVDSSGAQLDQSGKSRYGINILQYRSTLNIAQCWLLINHKKMQKSIRHSICISYLQYNNHNLNIFLKYKESSCKPKIYCTQKACMDPLFGLLKKYFPLGWSTQN